MNALVSIGLAAVLLSYASPFTHAQTFDLGNVQVHGFATQGFIYTTNNNWATTNSSDGSSAWTEAVINLTAQPEPKLRIGVQARYFLLGNYGNTIALDWAQGDYKVNERFGFRVGKVKTPSGLLNEIQDVDPAYLWVLLPQAIYDISTRDSILAHYGAIAYGKLPLGEKMGALEYRLYGGERVIGADTGFFQPFRDNGLDVPNGTAGATLGASLRWITPVHGLLVGASEDREHDSGVATAHGLSGHLQNAPFYTPFFFGRYERNRIMVSGEYLRTSLSSSLEFQGIPAGKVRIDQRKFYALATYRILDKLSAGAYYSSDIDRQAPLSAARFQKDLAIASRYDPNPYLYLKVEQHFTRGTLTNYSSVDNTNLQPNTRMTLLKLGVIF